MVFEACSVQEKYTNAFLISGNGTEDKNFALELTYNYGKSEYNIGNGFGHFALRVPDVYKTVDAIKQGGLPLTVQQGFAACFPARQQVVHLSVCRPLTATQPAKSQSVHSMAAEGRLRLASYTATPPPTGCCHQYLHLA